MRVTILLAITFLYAFPGLLLANDEIEWGEIPIEQWEIESFPGDDEAHSIILSDVGSSYININGELVFRRHLRVKILDVDESDFTEMSFQIYRSGRAQQLRDLDAHTLNRNPDGTVRTETVGSREFHSERSGGYETTSFAFPDVQPGSIVEVKYRIHSRGFTLMHPWYFQHNSPVLYSEYRVLVHGSLRYQVFQKGFEPYDVQEHDPNYPGRRWYNDMAVDASNQYYRWVLKDAPAVREEPYMTTVNDYRNSVSFFLEVYRDARGFQQSLRRSWDDIATDLYSTDYFGRQLSSSRSLRRHVREMTEGMADELEIAKKLYTHVARDVIWDGRYRRTAGEDVEDVLEQSSGSSAEKALLLTNMLMIADIEADPIMVSTRRNGRPDWSYPRTGYFNHVIVLVRIDEEVFLLDPLNDVIPFGMLMPNSINGGGFLISGRSGSLLQITPDLGSSKNSRVIASLDENGKIDGMIQSTFDGYEGILQRLSMDGSEAEEYFNENLLSDMPNTLITNFDIRNFEETDEILEARLQFENTTYSLVAGDMIYFNPFLADRLSENPFRNPVRNFPVEYPFGTTENYTGVIQIPQGFEVIEAPEDMAISLDEQTAFILQTQVLPTSIQVSTRFIRTGTSYHPELYDQKREFYNEIASVFNQQVVLQRITESGE